MMLAKAREGKLAHFKLSEDRLGACADFVADTILALHEARRDITLDELRSELGRAGVTVAISTLHRFFARHGITRKKRPATRSSRTAPTS